MESKFLFDSDSTYLQPNFSRITIADFDLYVHIFYGYISFFFDCILDANRIEKKFRLTIPRHEGDWNSEKLFNPYSGNLYQLEFFQIAMNAQWILYDFDTIDKVKQMFRNFEEEYKAIGIMGNPGYVAMRSDLNSAISELTFQNKERVFDDELCELTMIRSFIQRS